LRIDPEYPSHARHLAVDLRVACLIHNAILCEISAVGAKL